MKKFINDEFLLDTKQALKLYYDYAVDMPIIDFHCHLPPEEVAKDKRWDNIAEVWLGDDHYKWRTMRSNGIAEEYCTGNASAREKFDKFAETMPYLLRNPMYHWTHLELARYFDIDDLLLSPETADEIWQKTGEKLKAISARSLMKDSKVVLACSTDDPSDSLEYHKQIAVDGSFDIQVLPTWRPDKAMKIEDPYTYNEYLDKLSLASGVTINSYDDLLEALLNRHDYFHRCGCRLSDRGLDTVVSESFSENEADCIFARVRKGDRVTEKEVAVFQTSMLLELAILDAEKDWTMQLHIGAMRNNNTSMFNKIGPDTGFDSIADSGYAKPLSRFLDRLTTIGKLPKTIIYNLHPGDNEMLAAMLGNFQDGSVPGKLQLGSGWWFLDQKDGMEKQMEALGQLGLLRRFVGMVTDSRSFLSYTRHEYFRRILCSMLGNDMAKGIVPDDF
ncbi:MAG: glucuronate isomerase, partial [Proteobacteria bacterium]|nr:glucuronate isomerase [Pseudomonadota bacterium]